MRSTACELVSRFQGLPLISRSKGARHVPVILPVRCAGFRIHFLSTLYRNDLVRRWSAPCRHPGGGSGVRTESRWFLHEFRRVDVCRPDNKGTRPTRRGLLSCLLDGDLNERANAWRLLTLTSNTRRESAITEFWVHTSSDLQVATQRENPPQSAEALPTRIFSWVTGVPGCYQTRATAVCQIRVWWQADKHKPDNPKL
jgi:hypothetical protein